MLILAFTHIIGMYLYLYWSYWWFDILTHFLGGLSGGLAVYWVLFCSGLFWKKPVNFFVMMLFTVACLLVAGVAWEVFEYVYDIADASEGYLLDTSIDLIMDILGAVSAALIGFRYQKTDAISQTQ